MATETVTADCIRTGDEIEVALTPSLKSFRPVDKVEEEDGGVTITLFTQSGKRPKLKVSRDFLIVRRLPKERR